jgi:mono/diheme cytochrome c family protein
VKLPFPARVALTAVTAWLLVDLGLPLLAMWTTGAPRPVPLPGFARALYLTLLIAGTLVYLSASERTLAKSRTALGWLFGASPARRSVALTRGAILLAAPVLASVIVWLVLAPGEATPTSLRTQHPTLPQAWETLKNPIRDLPEAARRAGLAEGRELFQIACRPCHGAAGDGEGPMARGLRLKPADFTDPGTIATVVEPYAFWRVSEGGPGLPPEATPWDSAMPVWKHDLADLQRWKAVLAAYDVAGVEPRKPEGSRTSASPAIAAGSGRPIDDGQRIYVARCAPCHGERGDGKGPVAPYLDPDPRDFTSGVFRLRTTESGAPPTDDDLLRVVTNGIPGTAMPAWSGLPERERRAVIEYLKRFSETFKQTPTVVRPAKSIATSAAVVARGREVYRQAKCWECHGEAGRADGPSAATLKDDEGDPVTPANLTRGWRLKGGREAADIFMRLTTGMDGTPMPSYADTLNEEDRWALAHYVRSLQTDGDEGVVLRARSITGDVPRAADDPRWREAPPLSIPLAGQVITRPRWQNPAIEDVTARAVFNDRELALRLEWDDPTRDTEHREPGVPKLGRAGYVFADERTRDRRLRDALRVQLAGPGADRPYFLLGERGRPVTLWHWRADANAVTVERAEGTEPPPVEQPAAARVESRAEWKDGRWRLVLVRRLVPDDAREVAFTRGALVPFAIHAWDGSRGERDLMMSLSSWTFLLLEPAPSLFAPLAAVIAAGVLGGGEWLLVRRRRRSPIP